MRSIAHRHCSVMFFGLCTSVCLANSPNTILRQFAENVAQPNAEIIWVDADINSDGVNDLLVTTTNHRLEDDPRDYEWAVYAGNADGTYSRSTTSQGQIQQRSLSMRLDRYWVGYIPEIGRHGLLHLTCGTGGQAMCQFNALVLENRTFTNSPVGTPVNAEENFEAYSLRIQSKGHPTTSKATAIQVRQLRSEPHASQTEAITSQSAQTTAKPPQLSQPPASKKTELTPPTSTPSEELTSSTPWSIIVVLIVAATGLLWLLVKNRK